MKVKFKSIAINRSLVKATRHKQRGVSVMSVLLGLVIAAGVTAVVYDQFSDSQRKARIEAATAEISSIIAEAQKIYGATNTYGSVTTAIAVQSGVIPARLRVAGTNTAQNKYNGAITVAPATLSTTNDSLVLTYSNVPQADCMDVAMQADRMIRRLVIGANTPKATDAAMNVATLGTSCDAAATANLALAFGRQ
jgi:Tfp pilus assembly protein PilE